MNITHLYTPIIRSRENRADENPTKRDESPSPFQRNYLPAWLLLFAVIAFAFISFILGCAVRLHLLGRINNNINNDGVPTEYEDGESVPELLRLDGVRPNNSLYANLIHYEALVHPAMVSHPNPRRVAIAARGKGLLLREVLKHKTVVKVVQLDVGRDFLSEWSNCSDLAGSGVDSCFDDPRARTQSANAFEWFIDNFAIIDGGSKKGNAQDDRDEKRQDLFDVVIMDVDQLRLDSVFIQSLYNSIDENGVYAVQLGSSPRASDLTDKAGVFKEMLEEAGFESMHIYEDSHNDASLEPWSYLVAFKKYKTRTNWYKNAADIEIRLHQRMHRTNSNKPSFLYVDAPTMVSYQVPHRVFQEVYCRQEINSWACGAYSGFDPKVINLPMDSVQVRKSSVGENAGRGLFTLENIPHGSTIGIDDNVKSFHVVSSTLQVIFTTLDFAEDNEFGDVEDAISSLETFIEGYGVATKFMGEEQFTVDSGKNIFVNHGCNGTDNYGSNRAMTEIDVDLDYFPEDLEFEAFSYSILGGRHLRQFLIAGDHAGREIQAEEEILSNYLDFIGTPESWRMEVLALRGQCMGLVDGDITAYESKRKN